MNMNTEVVKRILFLSDTAWIRLINRLFRTEYTDDECVSKEWNAQEIITIRLFIGCANRYEFQVRCLNGVVQICMEDRGCTFQHMDAVRGSMFRVKEPQIVYFGKNKKEGYYVTREFPKHGRVVLPGYIITLEDTSVRKLMDMGLILFLPFLIDCFVQSIRDVSRRQEVLKYYVIHDIVGTLHESMKQGDLSVFDVQKLKQLCRHMLWKIQVRETWMQNLELQELLLDVLEADIGLLERMHRIELEKFRNKWMKN